ARRRAGRLGGDAWVGDHRAPARQRPGQPLGVQGREHLRRGGQGYAPLAGDAAGRRYLVAGPQFAIGDPGADLAGDTPVRRLSHRSPSLPRTSTPNGLTSTRTLYA